MKQKIALVLSGGGARGNAHIGVIEELENQGFEITSVTGTSMGSLVGGIYAVGAMEELKEWMVSLDRRRVFNLVDFTIGRSGMVKGDRVFKAMKQFIPDTRIEDLPIPYAAVAVDLISQHEVVFREGSLFDAIRASVSIPSVLTPVKTKDGLLVDGGVMNNIPVNHARRIEGDLLVVVNVNARIPVQFPELTQEEVEKQKWAYKKKIEEFQSQLQKIRPRGLTVKASSDQDGNMSYLSLAERTISLMMHHMAQMNLANHSPDILIEVSRDSCGTYDFFKAQELIEMGRYACKKSLESFGKEQP
jgi:NTE family protein